jgi:hypothetical protein
MKRLLAITLTLASIAFGAVSAGAKPSLSTASAIAAAGIAPQIRLRIGPRIRRRGYRRGYYSRAPREVTTQTRFVRVGRHVYRETYRVAYLPNGMTRTRLVSRVMVR